MGALVEQALPTLFGGVSKQPASVRRHNQHEEATNALMSVVTGGFEKRPGSQNLADLTFLDATKDYDIHAIDRDITEQTFLAVTDSSILAINAITGAQVTVTIGDTERCFLIEVAGINSTGIVEVDGADLEKQVAFDSSETAFDWSYELSDAATVFKVEGSVDGAVWNDIATGKTGASGTFSTTIDAVATGDHNYLRFNITSAAGTASDTITVKATFKDLTYLLGATRGDLRFVSIADNTFVVNRNETAALAEADSGTVTSTVQEFSDLPANSGSGNIHRVSGTNTDGFGTYYVQDDATTSTWLETADPNAHNNFAACTLPHQLVRNSDGTYTYSAASWVARGVGDETVTEAPSFIGKKIQDLTFYRNRLVFIADEEIFTSQSGHILHLWPEKAVDVLDIDPVARAATTTDVNILKFATVFRKILFATSRRAQFELSSQGAFTPESAIFDLATTYSASANAKPIPMGDVLYLPSTSPRHDVVYEYFFDEASLSNTAADITKHIVDYIPNDTLMMDADSTTGTLFLLTSGEQNSVFVYKTFFDGSEKLQSAWVKYTFGANETEAYIHGIAVLSGFLVMIIEREDGNIYLEQLPIERESQDATALYTPFLDQREVLTGSYSSGTGLTTWTMTAEHDDDAVVILGPSFSEPGIQLTTSYPTATTVTAVGDYSANSCWVGRPYDMSVTLSEQFMREKNEGEAILTGRLQLRDITFNMADTGYLKVTVTPEARDARVETYEGKTIGSSTLLVGKASIEDQSRMKVPVWAQASKVTIVVSNDTPLPSIVTSAAWRGFFNELSRQE